MTRYFFFLFCVFSYPIMAFAGEDGAVGTGYLAKGNNVKVYSHSSGTEIDDTVPANFPFLAYYAGALWGGGVLSTESESDGRLHVRYYRNQRNKSDGENTAWIDPSDVIKFRFDCCGDQQCIGIKAQLFTSPSYSDCFIDAANKAKTVQDESKSRESDIEALRLQLEIEKLKLEQERLKASTGK